MHRRNRYAIVKQRGRKKESDSDQCRQDNDLKPAKYNEVITRHTKLRRLFMLRGVYEGKSAPFFGARLCSVYDQAAPSKGSAIVV